jgi:hypothetical protein
MIKPNILQLANMGSNYFPREGGSANLEPVFDSIENIVGTRQ